MLGAEKLQVGFSLSADGVQPELRHECTKAPRPLSPIHPPLSDPDSADSGGMWGQTGGWPTSPPINQSFNLGVPHFSPPLREVGSSPRSQHAMEVVCTFPGKICSLSKVPRLPTPGKHGGTQYGNCRLFSKVRLLVEPWAIRRMAPNARGMNATTHVALDQ
jgi:hypothetical protein